MPAPATLDAPATVLCVDDDPDYLDLVETFLGRESDLAVRTETSPLAATDGVDDLDCLVTDYRMPERDGLGLLDAVRDRRPTIPAVVCTASSLSEVREGVVGRPWTEVVRKDASEVSTALLVHRVRRLVAHNRSSALAQRALAALDETGDGLAVVASDDRFALVNRSFARTFDAERSEMVGRDWREWFPDDEVDRLRSTALAPVRDDWCWTGTSVGCEADGGTFTVGTRIVGLDDGSFVVALTNLDGVDEE